MGKKFRGKNRRQGGGDRGGGNERGPSWKNYTAIPKENKTFQSYYDSLLEFSEEEKAQFWEALRRELPNSFRFCGSKGLLKTRYIPEITTIEHEDGRTVEPPLPVPWYPNEFAWWMTTPKNIVRRFPPFAAFQKFLVSETSVGNISRQEVVSMIPPLLMDVRPGHVVLDMCAAPGSKAAQLVEYIHQGEEGRIRKVLRSIAKEDGLDLGMETEEEKTAKLEDDPTDDGRATGLLIANDADYKRGHMLVHQLKRLSSSNLLVTNHDATQFPSIRIPNSDPNSAKNSYLKFDRILADVPCSGDGTLRKNVNLWRDWQAGSGLGLHNTQIRILVRALQMLKVGGRVVYSTCSMNPVENEAVIGAAIERCCGPDHVKILDCSDKLPELKRAPGMKSWKIIDKTRRVFDSWEEVQKLGDDQKQNIFLSRLAPSMFPAPVGSEISDLPLERCMRVYPHMQDTGAFFITVLEKTKEFKAKPENSSTEAAPKSNGATTATPDAEQVKKEDPKPASNGTEAADVKEADVDAASSGATKRTLEQDEGEQNPAKKAKTEHEGQGKTPSKKVETEPEEQVDAKPVPVKAEKRRNGPPEEPFNYLDPSHPVILNIKDFYKLSPRFPDDRYMVRNEMGEPAKAIYYTTSLIRDILKENEGRGLRVVHGGVRMYMKQDAPSPEVCRWRIQAEGMPILQGYVGQPRIVHLHKKETLRRLLIEMFPKIADGQWASFDEIGERVRDIGMGCTVLRVEPDGSDPDFTEVMTLPLWKSFHSLNLMLPKEDRSAMLLRIFNDRSPLINKTLQKQQGQKQQPKPAEDNDEPMDDEEVGDVLDNDAVEDLPSPE